MNFRKGVPLVTAVFTILLASNFLNAVPLAWAASPSTTTVKCTPDSMAFTAWATCTATVSPSAATGTVDFTDLGAFTDIITGYQTRTGAFDSTSCTLAFNAQLSASSCSVHFSYTATGCLVFCQPINFTITGNYEGDGTYLPSSGTLDPGKQLDIHSCWFSECLLNTGPGTDFTDYICAIGNLPSDATADCKAADTDYTQTSFDFSNQGIELPGANLLASIAGCPAIGVADAFAVANGYASGSSPGQVDTASLGAACAAGFPVYLAGAGISAATGGKPVPDSGLLTTLYPIITATPGAPQAIGDLAVAIDLGCGFANYYCYGANLTGNIIANPFNIQTKDVPFAPIELPQWGQHGGFSSIGWSLPSCTDSTFCTQHASLCGGSGTTAPCINPPAQGTAGEFDSLDISHPDYSRINTNAPTLCATGHINAMSIGYDGDADFNVNSTSVFPLVNPNNEAGGSLGPPNGIVAEIPPADRFSTTITADHTPVINTLKTLRTGMEVQICGRWVTDTRDLWNELHPITSLIVLPDYTLAASPPDVTIQAGESATFSATANLISGPSGPTPITLSVLGLPGGASASILTNPIPLVNPTSMTGTSTIQIATSPAVTLGDFPLTIQGTDSTGLAVETAMVNLHIYDYAVTVAPVSDTVLRGTSAHYTVTLKLDPGSCSSACSIPAMTLSQSGSPGDASPILGTPSMAPDTGGVSTTFVIGTAGPPGGSLGDYAPTVTATDPSGTSRSGSAALHIFDFTMTVSPADKTVLRGGSTSYAATLTLTPGSSAPPFITLGIAGLPVDASHSFSPTSLQPTPGGAVSVLSVTTGSTSLGDFPFEVGGFDLANGGGRVAAAANLHIYDFGITATVTPASPAYACASLPAPCLYVLKTGSNAYNVNVGITGGSTGTGLPQVTLSVPSVPSGAFYSFSINPGTPSFSPTLTISTSKAPPGTYLLTLTGTDLRPEGGTRTDQVTLVILSPQGGLQLVINQVALFKAAGVLTSGQAGGLTTKLQSAISYLNSGNTKNACSTLSSFVSTVNGYSTKGTLTKAQANLLLGGPLGVTAIMQSIPC